MQKGETNLPSIGSLPKPVPLKPKHGFFTQAVEEEPEFLDDLFSAMDEAEQQYQQKELLSPPSTSSGSSNSSNDISPSSFLYHRKCSKTQNLPHQRVNLFQTSRFIRKFQWKH
jgi:hypothetical protein